MPMEWYTPTEAESTQAMSLLAAQNITEGGELLAFRNAVLARAETNKNGDRIDAQGLQELAASIRFMPLDDEHQAKKVVGFFLDGQVDGDALLTSGVIFAGRFPTEAAAVRAGVKALSIEADITAAVCSVCGQSFTRRKDYCDHLQNMQASGAVRQVQGLKCVGGGIVMVPAGTNTTFDRSADALQVIASVSEGDTDERIVMLATVAETESAEEPPSAPDDAPAATEPPAAPSAEPDALTAALQAEQAASAQLRADLTAAQAARQEAEQALQRERLAHARALELLRAGMALDEVEALGAALADTTPEVVTLLAKYARGNGAPPPAAVTASVVTPVNEVLGDSPTPSAPNLTPGASWRTLPVFGH